MSVPPSLKIIVPSLKIIDGDTVTVNIAELKKLLPSLEIDNPDGKTALSGTLKLSIGDFRKLLRVSLSGVPVDEAWYLSHVSGLRQDIQKGKFESATEHYIMHGYVEGRLPERPVVDEKFYLQQYTDVAMAVKSGTLASAFDHFVKDGYAEGRLAVPPAEGSSPRAKSKK